MEQNDFFVTDAVAGCRLDKAITLLLCEIFSRVSFLILKGCFLREDSDVLLGKVKLYSE